MDSFSVFFRGRLLDDDILRGVHAIGASASCRAPGEIVISRQGSHLWVDSYLPSDLPSRTEWPLPRHDVGSILLIAVCRDSGSLLLAIEVANWFAAELGGMISWDGNKYWKTTYENAYGHNPSG